MILRLLIEFIVDLFWLAILLLIGLVIIGLPLLIVLPVLERAASNIMRLL